MVDRDIRQRDLIIPERLNKLSVFIVGVGAIGRQVALQLAAVGVPDMVLFDHDTVGVENLAAQGFSPSDIGKSKVSAVEAACKVINPNVNVLAINSKFVDSMAKFLASQRSGKNMDCVIFSCADSMQARQYVAETAMLIEEDTGKNFFSMFLDARMSAETIRVLAAINNLKYCNNTSVVESLDKDSLWSNYFDTLVPEEETYQDTCTGKTTIYTASIAAGMLVHQLTRWLRGIHPDYNLGYNVLASDMWINDNKNRAAGEEVITINELSSSDDLLEDDNYDDDGN